MEKNENGLPKAKQMNDSGGATNNSMPKSTLQNGNRSNGMSPMTDDNMENKSDNGSKNLMNNGCGEMTDNCLDSRPLAYVYAPNQRFCMLYSASDALDHGTLFEQLYKPVEVYGRE